MAQDQKPREFWLAEYETTKRQKRWHGFPHEDFEGYGPLIHVIEYSAYEALQKELEQAARQGAYRYRQIERQGAYRYRQIEHAVEQMGGWANFKHWISVHSLSYFKTVEAERARNQKLREALKHYAQEEQVLSGSDYQCAATSSYREAYVDDGGEIARKALAADDEGK